MSILEPSEQEAAEKSTGTEPAPKGDYICTLIGVSRWKNGTSLVWKFLVGADQPFAGKEFWGWTPLTDRGIHRTKARYADLGFPLSASEEDMVGTPCTVSVDIGTNPNNGEPNNPIVDVQRYDGEVKQPHKQTEDEEFDNAFGGPVAAPAVADDESGGLLS